MAWRPAKRGPSAGTLLQQIRRELQQGWTAGLTVLTGDDLFHLDGAQRALLDALVPEKENDFGLSVFGEERIDISKVVASARSRGMFAERRVVHVRSLEALDGEPDTLVEYAADPPPDSFLLVRAPELDKRRKLHKALFTAGRILLFTTASADPRSLAADVRLLAKEKELELAKDVVDFLIESGAGDMYRIAAELEKLAAWMASEGKRRVNLDVAREVATGGSLLDGWEVANAVLMRQQGQALAGVARLIQGGSEPLQLLGGLAWRARSMLQAKALLAAGVGEQEVVKATRSWGYKRELITGLSRYSLEELLRFPAALLEADRTLKSKSLNARAVLETLVERLTGEAGKQRLERR